MSGLLRRGLSCQIARGFRVCVIIGWEEVGRQMQGCCWDLEGAGTAPTLPGVARSQGAHDCDGMATFLSTAGHVI